MNVVPRLSLFFLASLLQRAHNFVLPLGPVSSSGSSLSAVQHYRLASRQLAASTAASTDQMGVSSSKPGGSEDGEILEPQGTHHPWWSLAPLNEASQWSSSPGEYFKDKSDAVGGAPVFKCHPGLASIAVLDHAAGEWFFNQPDSVLDRQVLSRHRSCRRSGSLMIGVVHRYAWNHETQNVCANAPTDCFTLSSYMMSFFAALA